MSKDLFIIAHEELIEEYLEAHPDADWHQAYEAVVDQTDARYREKIADMIDGAKLRFKDDANWPPRGTK